MKEVELPPAKDTFGVVQVQFKATETQREKNFASGFANETQLLNLVAEAVTKNCDKIFIFFNRADVTLK